MIFESPVNRVQDRPIKRGGRLQSVAISELFGNGKQQGDFWDIKVVDNGIGMDEKRVKEVMHKPASVEGLGIGLQNVASRTTGFFGDEASFVIESALGVGTTAYFSIPTTAELADIS